MFKRLVTVAAAAVLAGSVVPEVAQAAVRVPFSVKAARVISIESGKMTVEVMSGAAGDGVAAAFSHGSAVSLEITGVPGSSSVRAGDLIAYSGWAEDHSTTRLVPIVSCSGNPVVCRTVIVKKTVKDVRHYLSGITTFGRLMCARAATSINVAIPWGEDYGVRIAVCRSGSTGTNQRLLAGRFPTRQVSGVKLAITFADGTSTTVAAGSENWTLVSVPAVTTNRGVASARLTFDVLDDGAGPKTYPVGPLTSPL